MKKVKVEDATHQAEKVGVSYHRWAILSSSFG